MKCPVINCKKEIKYGRKTCEMHYMRMHRNGDFHNKKKSKISRKISFTINENGCFEVDSHAPYTTGYFVAKINGVRKQLHRHVYEECFGDIPEGMFICHKCDNKKCINPEHLEVGTHEKNVQDAVDRGLYRIGESHPNSKLTESEVVSIKIMLSSGMKNIDIAKVTNAHKDTVSDIKRGKAWKHVVI